MLKRFRVRKLPPEEASWLASALDFEGSLSLLIYRQNGYPNVRWMPLFQLSVVDEILARRVKELIGAGSLGLYKNKKRDRARPIWHYRLHANGLRELLPQIKPYVLSKSEQLSLVLESLELTRQNLLNKHASFNGNLKRLNEIRNRILGLNQNGLRKEKI